jgi:hypothetical protein
VDCKMLDRNPFRSGLLYPREGAGLDENPRIQNCQVAKTTLLYSFLVLPPAYGAYAGWQAKY